MKKIVLTMLTCTSVLFANAQLITRDFLTGYTVGNNLEKGTYANTTQGVGTPIMANQWSRSGKDDANNTSGANPKTVAALTYSGYSESGKDVAVDLLQLAEGGRTSIYSIASDNVYGAGTYYVAFMYNVSAASTDAGNEFFSIDGNYTGNSQRARFGVKGINENTYAIGLGDGGVPTDFSGTYNFNQTYLAVVKVTIDGTGVGTTWVYINPDTKGTEPTTATATCGITGTALKSVRGIVIRQRSSLAAQIGGIRLAKSWSDALGESQDDGGTYVSKEIIHENFQNWPAQASNGNYTQSISVGTATGNVVMANCIIEPEKEYAAASPSSTGRLTLQKSNGTGGAGAVEFPEVSSCGSIKLNLNSGSLGKSLTLQKKSGDTWVELKTFTLSSTAAEEGKTSCVAGNYEYEVKSATPVTLRVINPTTSTIYIWEAWVTDYIKTSTYNKQASTDKGNVISTRYYTLTGVRVQEPASGIFIQQSIYENGAVETIKIMK